MLSARLRVLRRIAAWLLLAGVLGAQPAAADVLIRQDFAALHGRAERLIRARVASVQSAWTADGSFIYSFVALDVLHQYKGSGPGLVQVRVPGGRVGGYRIWAASMPQFQGGEEVLVFLTRWPDGAFKVAGYAQGLSRVVSSPQGAVLHGGTLDGRLLADVERELRAGGPHP
jgi:hypothetical protein